MRKKTPGPEPQAGPGQAKLPLAMRVRPSVRDYLRSRDNYTQTVENLIMRSRAYREWKQENDS